MEHPVDFYSDTNYEMFKQIEKHASVDELLKKDIPDYSIIPQKSWAYIEKEASGEYVKRFPIDSKVSVELSRVYLEENKNNMDKVAYDKTKAILDKAAIAMDMAEQEKVAAVKTETPETQIVSPKTNEEVERGWKDTILNGANGSAKEDVLGAIQKYDHYSDKLNPRDAFDVAKKVIKRANEFGISISKTSRLYKYKMVDESVLSKNASVVIKMRKPYYNEELKKLAVELGDSLHTMTPVESANALYEMDKMAGVTQYYKGEVPDPFTNMFGKSSWGWISRHKESRLEKEAEAKLSVYFNKDIVKQASVDVMKTYRSLGPQARGVFRTILDKVNFDETEKA